MGDFVFSERWSDVRSTKPSSRVWCDRLEAELRRELSVDHSLFGANATAIARCNHCDDALFALPEGSFAVVHLTWSGKAENVPWPTSELHGTPASVRDYLLDHDEW